MAHFTVRHSHGSIAVQIFTPMRSTYKPLQRRKSRLLSTMAVGNDMDKYWKSAKRILDVDECEVEEYSFLEKSGHEDVDGKEVRKEKVFGLDSLDDGSFSMADVRVDMHADGDMHAGGDVHMDVQDMDAQEMDAQDMDVQEIDMQDEHASIQDMDMQDKHTDVQDMNVQDIDVQDMNVQDMNVQDIDVHTDVRDMCAVNRVNDVQTSAVQDMTADHGSGNNGIDSAYDKENISNDTCRKRKKSFFDFNVMRRIEDGHKNGENDKDGMRKGRKLRDKDVNVEMKDRHSGRKRSGVKKRTRTGRYAGNADMPKDMHRQTGNADMPKDMHRQTDNADISRDMHNERISSAGSECISNTDMHDSADSECVLNDVSALQLKNGFVPLVIEGNLETALLNLQENAYIEETATAKAFSFYVQKGKFVITRADKEYVLRRDGMLIIGEGEPFVCRGVGKSNVGIVTYKVK